MSYWHWRVLIRMGLLVIVSFTPITLAWSYICWYINIILFSNSKGEKTPIFMYGNKNYHIPRWGLTVLHTLANHAFSHFTPHWSLTDFCLLYYTFSHLIPGGSPTMNSTYPHKSCNLPPHLAQVEAFTVNSAYLKKHAISHLIPSWILTVKSIYLHTPCHHPPQHVQVETFTVNSANYHTTCFSPPHPRLKPHSEFYIPSQTMPSSTSSQFEVLQWILHTFTNHAFSQIILVLQWILHTFTNHAFSQIILCWSLTVNSTYFHKLCLLPPHPRLKPQSEFCIPWQTMPCPTSSQVEAPHGRLSNTKLTLQFILTNCVQMKLQWHSVGMSIWK